MSTKAFLTLLVAVVVLGGSLGGAFAGGIALGKSQEEGSSTIIQPPAPLSEENDAETPSLGAGGLTELQERLQSGEFTPEDLAKLRQQFQGDTDGGFRGFGAEGFGAGGALTGTIARVEGSIITVDTARGPLEATIRADTTLQIFAESALEDLVLRLTVSVVGQPDEGGAVEALSVTINPPGGDDGFFGGRPQRGDLFGGDPEGGF